jgi:hypothetical protein
MKDDSFTVGNIRAALNGEKSTKRIKALVDEELLRYQIRKEIELREANVDWKMKMEDVLERGCMENQTDD